MKKVLIVASVISFIEWFNRDNVDYLASELGCEVHIACNLDYMNDTDCEKTQRYIDQLTLQGIVLHNIHFSRSPIHKANLKAYKALKKLIGENHFDLIHCHTPAASMLTRLAAKKARKKGTKVMYTCHGFHFHKASPKSNWIKYYLIEKKLSKYCDYLVTINREDFDRAKKFHCKNVRYIPGVGVDLKKFDNVEADKDKLLEELHIPQDAVILLSVGELIERKNHEVIIRALGELKDKNIYYLICGKGPLEKKLLKTAKELDIADQVFLLGFRNDVNELCAIADIGAFPSRIEGLGLAGIEQLAAGAPLVSSNIHGIMDYMIDGETGFVCPPDDVRGFAKAIRTLASDPALRLSMRPKCKSVVAPYDTDYANKAMRDIYNEILIK